MKISKEAKNHLKTAMLLMDGINATIKAEPLGYYFDNSPIMPPGCSKTSVIRRCIQVREELNAVITELNQTPAYQCYED